MPDTKGTVFIVDDDPSVRKSLTRLIRTAGLHVEAYASGREFLARMPLPERCCLILDLVMPDMSGREVWDRVIAFRPLHTIFLTGGTDFARRLEAATYKRNGLCRFFTKPVDATLLLDAVQAALQNASSTPIVSVCPTMPTP